MKFMGYSRPDGTVGIRNHLLILPSVVCANDTVRMVAQQLNGAVYVEHQHGCSEFPGDAAQTRRTLAGFAGNPNVGACLVIGLGCETVEARDVVADIAKTGKHVECLIIQDEGGTINAVAKGVKIGAEMLRELSEMKREEQDLSSIIFGLECGGSDAWSGLSGNPAIGEASDLLIAEGGTSILSETTELIGAEHLLAKRARDKEVADRIYEIVKRVEEGAIKAGVDIRLANPSPGNLRGGITTLEEKSLGCIHKAGSKATVEEVLEYAERPTKKGLVVMDTPGNDVESITGMAAGGAQIMAFTTGRGSCTGSPIAPIIKVATNSQTFNRMRDNMDINAGTIVDGQSSIEEVGRDIFNEIIEVCNGKLTKAERLGLRSFGINRIGPTE